MSSTSHGLASPLLYNFHCHGTYDVLATPLFLDHQFPGHLQVQDVHCHWTYISKHQNSQKYLHCSSSCTCRRIVTPSATRLLQHLSCHRTSTDTGPPLSHHLHCLSTSFVTGRPLSQPLYSLRTSHVAGASLSQNLHFPRTSTVTGPPMYSCSSWQVIY